MVFICILAALVMTVNSLIGLLADINDERNAATSTAKFILATLLLFIALAIAIG